MAKKKTGSKKKVKKIVTKKVTKKKEVEVTAVKGPVTLPDNKPVQQGSLLFKPIEEPKVPVVEEDVNEFQDDLENEDNN